MVFIAQNLPTFLFFQASGSLLLQNSAETSHPHSPVNSTGLT